MLRKLIATVGVGVAVVAIGVAVAVWLVGRAGQTRVERVVSQRLQRIANHYLQPRLSLGELDYQYPRTVLVRDARLTTDEGLDILTVERMELVFAEVPRQDRPLRIERVTLTSPRIHVADSLRLDGRVAGWSDLLRPEADEPMPSDAGAVRLSDVFQMRHVRLIDGHVIYTDRNGDDDRLPTMDLGGISAELNVEPDAQGWYVIDTAIAGPARFTATVKGRLDLDDLILQLDELALRMRLDRQTDEALPPFVQEMLRRHEVTGRLRVTASGQYPLLQLDRAQGVAQVRVENVRAVLDDMLIDLNEAGGEVVLRPGRVVARRLEIKGYDGQAAGRFSMTIRDDGGLTDADVQLTGENLRLERLIRATVGEEEAAQTLPLAGRLSFATHLTGPAASLHEQASGTGWLEVNEGALARLPLLLRLRKMMGLDTALPPEDRPAGKDTARIEWTYAGDRARLTKIEALTRWLALRGEGDLRFDGSLDLRVNAGPMERLQHALGRVGDWMASVTDRLVSYSVTGHVGNPQIRVRPLGLSAASPDTAMTP